MYSASCTSHIIVPTCIGVSYICMLITIALCFTTHIIMTVILNVVYCVNLTDFLNSLDSSVNNFSTSNSTGHVKIMEFCALIKLDSTCSCTIWSQ